MHPLLRIYQARVLLRKPILYHNTIWCTFQIGNFSFSPYVQVEIWLKTFIVNWIFYKSHITINVITLTLNIVIFKYPIGKIKSEYHECTSKAWMAWHSLSAIMKQMLLILIYYFKTCIFENTSEQFRIREI